MRARRAALGLAAALATLTALTLAPGKGRACELALIVALDVSASVDAVEYALQRDGLADALEDAEVAQSIEAVGGLWLSVFEWSGARRQDMRLDWTFLASPAEIAAVAAGLRGMRRSYDEFPTSLGYALGYAMIRLREAPAPCRRRVIDVSGDGVNNDGFPPSSAYRAHDMAGVTVNALAIAGEDPPPAPYYAREVIRGPGAFVEVARGYRDYARAMKRKLLREINGGGFASVQQAAE